MLSLPFNLISPGADRQASEKTRTFISPADRFNL